MIQTMQGFFVENKAIQIWISVYMSMFSAYKENLPTHFVSTFIVYT